MQKKWARRERTARPWHTVSLGLLSPRTLLQMVEPVSAAVLLRMLRALPRWVLLAPRPSPGCAHDRGGYHAHASCRVHDNHREHSLASAHDDAKLPPLPLPNCWFAYKSRNMYDPKRLEPKWQRTKVHIPWPSAKPCHASCVKATNDLFVCTSAVPNNYPNEPPEEKFPLLFLTTTWPGETKFINHSCLITQPRDFGIHKPPNRCMRIQGRSKTLPKLCCYTFEFGFYIRITPCLLVICVYSVEIVLSIYTGWYYLYHAR